MQVFTERNVRAYEDYMREYHFIVSLIFIYIHYNFYYFMLFYYYLFNIYYII